MAMSGAQDIEAAFVSRLASVLVSIRNVGRHDPDIMRIVGRLGLCMLEDAGKHRWTDLKRGLTPATYSSLVTTFQNEGNRLHREGKRAAVYAMDVLATSIVAGTMPTPVIAGGDKLLDAFIEEAIRRQRRVQHGRPADAP
jgi:hypothetical protein